MKKTSSNQSTILIALLITVIGYSIPDDGIVFSIGVFAFSGAITNWLAIHILFYRVPLLYGSGVIPRNFASFIAAIRDLLLLQFFNTENLRRFANNHMVLDSIDYDSAFERLCNAIEESPLGSLLAFAGGRKALLPLKPNLTTTLQELAQEIGGNLEGEQFIDELHTKIKHIIEAHLNELTPQKVRDMLLQIIEEHLGWLVIWGGVFGGLLGFAFGIYQAGVI